MVEHASSSRKGTKLDVSDEEWETKKKKRRSQFAGRPESE